MSTKYGQTKKMPLTYKIAINLGLAKNEKSATNILVIFSVICFSATVILAGYIYISESMIFQKIRYNFPDGIMNRFPTDLQQKINYENNK